MGRWPVTGLFGVMALLTAASTLETIESAVSGSGPRGWLLVGYSLLRTGIVIAFTLFVFTRGPAKQKSRDVVAFLACAGAIASVAALREPAESAAAGLVVAGELIALASCAWVLWAAIALGKCFGVLPEARGLVMCGPYRIVRHPMYLGELGACAGLVVASPEPWNLAAAGVFAAAQAIRMGLEERTLAREFPRYSSYAASTGRLIPALDGLRAARQGAERA
jgi:protein-S-isoprenylcysteine O-methyltransferase Ste14